jgi:7-carboxy-7-deazaguanine synthase
MDAVTYPVTEIFRSIQGEGYHAGKPAVFIRLAGCNISPPCKFCDTDFKTREVLTVREIVGRTVDLIHEDDMIVITGGEPFVHDLYPLLQEISTTFPKNDVAVETNGTLYETQNPKIETMIDWLTVSPKVGYLSYAEKAIRKASEIKIVYGDYDPQKIEGWIDDRMFFAGTCFIQPKSEDFGPALEYVMKHPKWRLSVQLQKVLKIQ